MKTRWLIVLLAALLALPGCRVRVLAQPDDADVVLLASSETQPTEPPESEPAETEPPETAPPETDPTEITEAQPTEAEETDAAEASPSQTAPGSSPSQPAAPQNAAAGGADSAAQTAVPATEPQEEASPAAITVTYDPNGGESAVYLISVLQGDCYGAQPEAMRRGWRFDGWWTQPEGGELILPETLVTAQEDHTLWAHWQPAAGSIVTFDGNGGRVRLAEQTLMLSDGDLYGTLPVPLREGWDFLGWFTLPEGGEQITEQTVFAGDADLTLYAHWEYNPFAFWTFTLQNRTQQIYLCQQASVYYEDLDANVTASVCTLITDTGSFNIAANLDGTETTDEWVLAKNPDLIVKRVASMADAETARAEMQDRFPGKRVLIVTGDALGGGSYGLYARLYLAKVLYFDWYADVNLEITASELELGWLPIS